MSEIVQISTANTFQQWLTATQSLISKLNSLTDGGGSSTFYANTNVTIDGDLIVTGNITLDAVGYEDLSVAGSATIANTLSVTGCTSIAGVTTITNSTTSTSTSSGALVITGGLGVGGPFYGASVFDSGIRVLARANGGFGQANSAFDQANLAYNAANTSLGSFGQANSSFDQANLAYAQANTAGGDGLAFAIALG